ncbi:tetratricopeptide repeat protein, partial [Candidatus Puniceispirillum sp.]|nr:tetratricopeptide repeat protein [Candidatus Puniceispirillum sp.]
DETLVNYNKAISLKPDYADALNNKGNVLQELRRFDEALVDYNKAISLKPDYADAFNNRGNVLQELRRFDEALSDYKKAISLKPDYVDAFNNRGIVLRELGRFDEALADHNKAISLKPGYAGAFNNRGIVLRELRRFDEALSDYNKAISLKPDYAEAHWNKSLQLLLQGEFSSGWKLYDWRWKRKGLSCLKRGYSQPLWLGKEDLRGKTILLCWEQGLGDTIQFSRYVKEVSKLGCRVALEVQKPLFELMKGIMGVDELIEDGGDLPIFDYYCPLMSLPLALGTTIETIPAGKFYFRSTDDKLTEWSERLGVKSQPRVGIVWSGSAIHKKDHNRSIALEPLLGAISGNYELVSLQKEVREVDLITLERSKYVKHFGADIYDFADTAALCELMDIIVSVDTSVAHLAGTLGKPINLLLPYNPDFRWFLDRNDSPWYPSMKLFRQGPERLWEPVMEKVRADLEDRV